MEKIEDVNAVKKSLEKLEIHSNSNSNSKSLKQITSTTFKSSNLLKKTKPPCLVSMCLGLVGKHLEDIIEDLGEIAVNFPADIKMAVAAIARRRRLLDDDVIISLADSSWEILDISDSDVSDLGFGKVMEVCKSLRAVDIRYANFSSSQHKLVSFASHGPHDMKDVCREIITNENGLYVWHLELVMVGQECLNWTLLAFLDNQRHGKEWICGQMDHLQILIMDMNYRCDKITTTGYSELVQNCHSLETLRCGGSPRSDYTARRCLGIFKPKLNDVNSESWEELDTTEIANGAESLLWLVWQTIDKDSLEIFRTECPRITVNPKPSPFGLREAAVPREALPNITLDDPVVKDIDPSTWAVRGFTQKAVSPSLSSLNEMSVAEKFRLAFVERDTRLAPKRAKNARQHHRRAEREWIMMDARAKALALASQVTKTLQSRN